MADPSEISARLDSSVWLGIGAIGLCLFLLGIYQPALRGVPDEFLLEDALAVAGAVIAVVGFSFAYDQRKSAPARPGRPRRAHAEITEQFGPSFEIYDPKTAEEPAPGGPGRAP